MNVTIMNKKQENKIVEVLKAINYTPYVQKFNYKVENWDANMYKYGLAHMNITISRNDNPYETDTIMWTLFVNENGGIVSYRKKKVGSGMVEVKGLKRVINECGVYL